MSWLDLAGLKCLRKLTGVLHRRTRRGRASCGVVRQFHTVSRDLQRLAGVAGPLTIAIGTAIGIAIANFLAAQLGLALRAVPSDVVDLAHWPCPSGGP